ncbi:AI-2E family transporter [Pseudonocardia sp. S2-4]|uniref:AI-2E family transporter n=2 Tax=Pseudonocardia humida TaxID=2800819 RepID=A0ABT1A6U1_9PSEU|nr:AI-2E family transporter [Pseudonocardia humida]
MGERIPAAVAKVRAANRAVNRAIARPSPSGGRAPTPAVAAAAARRTAVRPPPPRPEVSQADDVKVLVPQGLRVSAAIGWRLLVVVAALLVVGFLVSYLAAVVVPVAIALLLSALLAPAVSTLHDNGVPRGLATALVLIGGLALLGGVLTFVIVTFVRGVPDLGAQLNTSINSIITWLTTGPLHLSNDQLREFQDQILTTIDANQASITASALTTATTIGQTATEALLVIFTLIFFLHGGSSIWQFLLSAVPGRVRTRIDVAGRRGLAALVSYVRATAVVAVVDAVAIGIGLGIMNIPLAVPLAALVFLGAFIPIIGAVVAGSVSVLIALVAQGPIQALIVLAIIIAVMQLEGHVLQPLLLGRAVKLHPLAVVLAIAVGLVVAGIAGALLAVPLLAVLNSGIRSLRSPADEHVDPDQVHTSEPEQSGPDEPGIDRHDELGGHDEDEGRPDADDGPDDRRARAVGGADDEPDGSTADRGRSPVQSPSSPSSSGG